MERGQRYVFELQFDSLEEDVRKRYLQLCDKQNKEKDKQKKKNALCNAVVSRDGSIKTGMMVKNVPNDPVLRRIVGKFTDKYDDQWTEGKLAEIVQKKLGKETYNRLVKSGGLKEGQVSVCLSFLKTIMED
jgi:hypothetical protein